jgi:hypothetical protein
MHTIHVQRQTKADAARLFALLADPTSYREFPGVRSAELLQSGATERHGVGALRRIVVGTFRFDEKITHHEPGRRLDYQIVDSSPRIDHQGGTIRFTPTAEGTGVEWISTFRVPVPVLGHLIARFGGRRMRKAFDDAIRVCEQLAIASAPVRPALREMPTG